MNRIPVVGQTLYSLNSGNYSRHKPKVLTPVTVTKVGRKYFTCAPLDRLWDATEFHLFNWREKTEYSANQVLYASEQEWQDEKEAAEISGRIYEAFPYGRNIYSVPLPALREIDATLSRCRKASQ